MFRSILAILCIIGSAASFSAQAKSATYYQAEVLSHVQVSCAPGNMQSVVRYITLDVKDDESAQKHFATVFCPQLKTGAATAGVSCTEYERGPGGSGYELMQLGGPRSTMIRSAKLVKRVDADTQNYANDWTSVDLGMECSQ